MTTDELSDHSEVMTKEAAKRHEVVVEKTNVLCMKNTIDLMAAHASLELPLDFVCAFGAKSNKDVTLEACVTKLGMISGSTSLLGHGGGIVNSEHTGPLGSSTVNPDLLSISLH